MKNMARYYVAEYDKIPERAGMVCDLDGEEVVLFKLSDGSLAAIENKSPHPKGGTLGEALVSGHFIYCPVYDWKISLRDGLVQAPDSGQAKIFHTERDGNDVIIVK